MKQDQHHWVKHWNQTQRSLNSIWVVKTKERRYTKDIHQQITLFPINFSRTGNFNIKEGGAIPLSEALKSNTTLTKLDLSSEDKRRAIHMTLCLSLVTNLVKLIGTYIYPKGGVALSEALKVNSSLTDLNLEGNNKRKHAWSLVLSFIRLTNRLHSWTLLRDSIERGIKGQHNTHETQSEWWTQKERMKAQELHPLTFNFEITTGNRLHSEGVIALCESLKTNTTLTDLSLYSEPLV